MYILTQLSWSLNATVIKDQLYIKRTFLECVGGKVFLYIHRMGVEIVLIVPIFVVEKKIYI